MIKDFLVLLVFTVLIMIITKIICMRNIEKFTSEEPIVVSEESIVVSEITNVTSETSTVENSIEERREVVSEEITNNNIDNIVTTEVSEETIKLPDLVVSGGDSVIIGQSNNIRTSIGVEQSIGNRPTIFKGQVILTDGNNTIELNEGVNYLKDLNASWIKNANNLVLTYGNNAEVILDVGGYNIFLSEPNTTTLIFTSDMLKLMNTIYRSPTAFDNTFISVTPKLNSGHVIIEAVDNNGNLNSITYKAPLESIDIPSWIVNSNKISYKLGSSTNILFMDNENKIITGTMNPFPLSKSILDIKDNPFMHNKYSKVKKISITNDNTPSVYDKQNNEKNIRDRISYIINFVGVSKETEGNKQTMSESESEEMKSSISVWIYIIGGILGVGFIGAMIYFLMKK